MKKNILAWVTVAMLTAVPFASAKDKLPNIQTNTSNITNNAFINNVATAAMGMGVKEPLSISETQANGKRTLLVAGSNSTTCRINISEGDAPKMMGISCK
ncbi:hypothetical protein [Wielerella bovis]|uniref:hypothetical protein n=1 Tax=Wielerella bovis TaxID=2917790 RepID=UPI00201A09D7|nr:hypothetical protein [Wielerella bovis]MCG7656511.1 hypothetical protein [Wielerella bovis]MCG7658736.1 hypothetical protein [Wielerella bovis]ULJ60899.1 hypothetical protein MIS44_03300 [Wielerella bovis]